MLQASPQKIDLHRLLADLALQRDDATFLSSTAPSPGKRLAPELPQLPSPALQDVRVYLTSPRHLGNRCSQLQPPNCGFLELPSELPSIQSHDTILHSLKIVPYSFVSISGSTPPWVRTKGIVGSAVVLADASPQ